MRRRTRISRCIVRRGFTTHLGAALPIAFSQVREDPAVDETILAGLPPGARVFMIASGGDTAASLVASGRVSHLHLVDINPAQLASAARP